MTKSKERLSDREYAIKIMEMISALGNRIDEIRESVSRIEKEIATHNVRIEKLEDFEKEFRNISVKVFFALLSAITSVVVSIISLIVRR